MINKSKIVKEAQRLVAKGQLDKAIAEYAKITAAIHNDSNTHNTIGDLYIKLGNKDKAIGSFKAAADILNKDGFTLKAIALYKKVLNINPDQVDVQMLMGKLNAERGMLGNANENYLTAASYFTKQGKRDKALEVYKILCNLNPKNITLAQKLSELYMSEGMVAEGLSKIIELAEIKARDGEIGEARQYLEKARSKGSDRRDFIMISSLVDLKDGHLPEAVESLEKLRDLDPNDAEVLSLLGEAYMLSGRYEDAASTIEELLDSEPSNADYRKKLIDIHIKSGDFNAAWEQYRDQVGIYMDKKEYNKAQKLIQEYLEHNPDSIDARQVLADMFTSIGREDRISELHVEMAEIYVKNGDTEKAFNIYNKLLEKEPDNENYKTAIASLGQTKPVQAPAPGPAQEPPIPEGITGGLEEETPPEALGQETPEPESPFGGFEEPETEVTEEEAPSEDFVFGFEPAAEHAGPEETAADFSGGSDEEAAPVETPFGGYEEEQLEPESGEPGRVYDLSEIPEELPPLEFGQDTEEDIFPIDQPGSGVYEIPEDTSEEPEGLDIFGTGKDEPQDITPAEDEWTAQEPPSYDALGLESDSGYDEPAHDVEEPAYQEASSFEESLTEADVYIKYGLYPKAAEVLASLDSTHPSNPDVQLRFIDICKAQNDMDGFVERSLQLAGIYKSRGMDEEAKDVLEKAVQLSPGDERLMLYMESAGMRHDIPSDETPSPFTTEELVEDESGAALSSIGEGEISLSPGSVGFIEELAEADFYSKQGLYDEAKGIYRRLLAADPENDDIRDKYNRLLDAEGSAAQEAAENLSEDMAAAGSGAEVPEEQPSAFDSELDDAFREMDLGPAEPDETPAEVSAPAGEDIHAPLPEEDHYADEPASVSEEPAAVAEEDGFFDLAAELREEMGADIIAPTVHTGTFGDSGLDEVFQEFRKGVNEQLGSEDYETHYNLGIAYKEMGMIDEALSEFAEASKDKTRTLDCASMLGLCHLEKGEYNKAIEHFKRGLEVKGREKEEYFGLKYDMATAYELSGDPSSAFGAIAEIYSQDQEFRDVKKRYQRLEKAVGTSPEDDGQAGKDTKAKKSRVSYL